jgi:hypothetical protein
MEKRVNSGSHTFIQTRGDQRGFGSATTIITNAFFITQLYQLIQDYGIPLAEVARQLGVSMSAISKAITRKTKG